MPMINVDDFVDIIKGEIEQCEDLDIKKRYDDGDFITASIRDGELSGYDSALDIVQDIIDERR